MHLWIITLSCTKDIAVFIRTLSLKLFSAIANNYEHYNDVIMGAMASQITSMTIVYSTVYSDADQRKHQRSASLAFMRGIHRWPKNSPHKWPVKRKMLQFDDVIITCSLIVHRQWSNHNIWGANHPNLPRAIIQPHNETKHSKSMTILIPLYVLIFLEVT